MAQPQSLFAQGTLPEGNVRALDQLRQRLQQMSISLTMLKTDLTRTESLPTWDSLQTRAGLLANDLQQIQTIFDAHRSFLTAAHPYPHASFPAASEPVLQMLLRKKAEPAVEAWIEDNTNPAKVAKWDDGAETGLQEDEQRELWAFAFTAREERGNSMNAAGVWDLDYTLAEKKAGLNQVVTGLRRKLNKYLDGEEEDEDEDEDEDEEMGEDAMPAAKPPNDPFGDVKGVDTSKPALPVEAWLKFMSIMVVPQVPGK